MQNIEFQQRLRYRFDNVMARGAVALIGWLGLVTVVLIGAISVIVMLFRLDEENRNFIQIAWGGLMRMLDAGTMGGDTGSWGYLLLMLLNTLGGIFVLSILIGVISSGIEGKLDELRKGRSFVAEGGHTVILGWSSNIFNIVSELVLANANQARSCITILADKDVVEMQDEMASKVGDYGRTHLVFRNGNPTDLTDLAIVNPDSAKSIIVLPPSEGNPDASVIKTLLALLHNPKRQKKDYHIVTYIRDAKNWDVARMVGGEEAEVLLASDLLARITAQTCRQSGLSVAYIELLDYGGDEIYFKSEPMLEGKSFGDALFAYEDSAVMGVHSKRDGVLLNPSMDRVIEEGDEIIVVSADDDTIRLSLKSSLPIDSKVICQKQSAEPLVDSILILGWNEHTLQIVRELDQYVAAGSRVKIVAADGQQLDETIAAHRDEYTNLSVETEEGDITDRTLLNRLTQEGFQHLIVISEPTEEATDAQDIDARTLIALLHLRDIAEKRKNGTESEQSDFGIVSEMLDIRNRELAQIARADDFVVSDRLISLLLAQISENKNLAAVFQDLFDPEGSEIYFKAASNYVQLDKPVSFYTILEAARQRGEVALGYRMQAQAYDAEKAYGVKLNPIKSEMITLGAQDRIIVLAES